jgi:hypothetical protein
VQPSSSTWLRLSTVNHHILICRLKSLGFSNDCLVWYTNYFSDRVHCVNRRACCPDLYATRFNSRADSFLCINDVALAAGDSLIHLYADDTILYTTGYSLDTVLTSLGQEGQY